MKRSYKLLFSLLTFFLFSSLFISPSLAHADTATYCDSFTISSYTDTDGSIGAITGEPTGDQYLTISCNGLYHLSGETPIYDNHTLYTQLEINNPQDTIAFGSGVNDSNACNPPYNCANSDLTLYTWTGSKINAISYTDYTAGDVCDSSDESCDGFLWYAGDGFYAYNDNGVLLYIQGTDPTNSQYPTFNTLSSYFSSPTEAPPVTTTSLSPSPYTDGKYSDPTTVTLSATASAGYTVADTYYTIDGGTQQTYSSPFTITGAGNHTITYWSVDNNGATEATNTQTFTITEAYSISGTVFTDSNYDGVQDNGEQGYANATVNVSQNNQTVASTTSGNDGSYSFPSLEAGTYSVAVTVPLGDIATTSNPATADLTANTTENFGIAPATTTLTPSQDSFLQHNGQNQNEGASPFLELSVEGKERALVQFNESQIQAAIGNDPNYTAVLQLTIVSNNNKFVSGGGQIDVDRMEQAWTEGNGSYDYNGNRGTGSGVTWDCATDSNVTNDSTNCSGSTAWDMIDTGSWPFDGTPTATGTISNNQSGTASYNVTSDVQSFLSGTNTNYGWIVKKDNENQDGDVQFGSKESIYSPKLIITRE